MNETKEVKACLKCGKVMDADAQFYKRKDGSRMDLCKKCLTMNFKRDGYSIYSWRMECIKR